MAEFMGHKETQISNCAEISLDKVKGSSGGGDCDHWVTTYWLQEPPDSPPTKSKEEKHWTWDYLALEVREQFS